MNKSQIRRAARHTGTAAVLTELMLETFRLNGRLLAAGDKLVAPIGLTSARWQVIGAVALAGHSLPVAHIARNMGLARQSVQRVVNDLEAAQLVRFAPNPHHRRARLVELTEKGCKAYDEATALQVRWANALAAGMRQANVEEVVAAMRSLRVKLEGTRTNSGKATETDDE
jgi:DNA-binding MarR family transcriptional regulator